MKKSNMIIFILTITLLSLTIVSAKQMNVSEIGEAADKIAPNSRYIFIIGKYAYTSNYNSLNLQDVMIAAADSNDSKNNSQAKDSLKTMTIYHIDRTYNGYTPIGWQLGTNEIGTGTALNNDAKIEIKYINYTSVETLQTVSNNSKDNTPVSFLNSVISNYKVPYNKVLSNRVSQRLFI